MSTGGVTFAFVVSTEGSVMNEVLKNPFLRGCVHSVVADRPCGAIAKAEAHGLPVVEIFEPDPEVFCQGLHEHLRSAGVSHVLSYYTNFYSQAFRDAFRDRIVNFHPSLLPAFKGMDGFGDTLAYHARLFGNTIEFIDQVMDEGKIVMQTAAPVDPGRPVPQLRHELFVQQCQALLQVARWLWEGRVSVDGRKVTIQDAVFEDASYSPALDFDEARRLREQIPMMQAQASGGVR